MQDGDLQHTIRAYKSPSRHTKTMEYSDKELLEMFATEDNRSRAFELLVEKYSKRIYWAVRKIVVSHHDADDIVQDIFVKLWKSLPTFRGEAGLYTWIYRIAVNESLSLLRKRKSHFFASDADTSAQLIQISQEEGLINSDAITAAIERAILNLPSKQRIVFNMRYYDDLPYQQMSEILDTSVGALKASYHHALQKIEASLKLENFLEHD